MGIFQCAAGVERIYYRLDMLGAVTLFNRLADHLPLWLCPMGDGVDEWQCGFTFGEVITYVLAQLFGVGSIVQQVIG